MTTAIRSERGHLIRSAPTGERRSMPAVLSTGLVARDRHRVDPEGWVHGASVPLIDTHGDVDRGIRSVLGRVTNIRVGRVAVESGDSIPALLGTLTFADSSVNADAETAYQLYRAGFADSLSVSFIPLDYAPAYDRGSGAMDINSAELLECSVCAVPSDVNAKVLARALHRQYGGSATTADRRAIAAAIRQRVARDDSNARAIEDRIRIARILCEKSP